MTNSHPLYHHLDRIRARIDRGGFFTGWLSHRDAARLLEMFEDRAQLVERMEAWVRREEAESARLRDERDTWRRAAKAADEVKP